MTDLQLILIGFALGSIPSYELSAVLVAAIARRLGVSPKDVARYDEATKDDSA